MMTDGQISDLNGRANLLSLSLFDAGRLGDAGLIDELIEELELARAKLTRAELTQLAENDHSPLLSK